MKVITFLFTSFITAPAFSQGFLPTVNHASWDALLKEFVNERHVVDYSRFKQEGWTRLNTYVVSLSQAGSQPLSPNEKEALLINAYNAFTIQWVLQNYPVASIWRTSSPFRQARHRLSGRMVSLDEIESQLRALGDPRIHAALVCAARSCPPLRREAYVAARLDEQLDDNVREWLATPSLNEFDPAQNKAQISPIFKWYRQDFDKSAGGLEGFLRKYAPQQAVEALGDRKLEIDFRDYDWGLNDQSDPGKNYSKLQFAIDWIRNWFRSLSHR